ncbi:hypothetical protein L1987_45433 [Smallanthus sonchifolius]|uniref:Uncharacterized protein n=1 Tax=Smallanthus sonchifolius TaxID=185202 RepID=A0ACB9FX08_9ASTR|nr:hypothetical protein L1987_45433 [Smallanthus sonchifolius]
MRLDLEQCLGEKDSSEALLLFQVPLYEPTCRIQAVSDRAPVDKDSTTSESPDITWERRSPLATMVNSVIGCDITWKVLHRK